MSLPPHSALAPSSENLVKGDLWQIGARHIKIGHVGRLLVHHRTVDPLLKRISRESLDTIEALQRFLTLNNAVLMTATS